MRLPNKIIPNPIIETVVELRFSTNIHRSAVFGILFNALKDEFNNNIESLPILQMPEQLRDLDPNFKFKPYYKITDGKFVVQIGPDVFSISSPIEYPGWNNYSTKIIQCLQKVQSTGIIREVVRLGIRYINFFENNIFENIKLKLLMDNEEHQSRNTSIRTEIERNEYKATLQITNNFYGNVNNKELIGSLVDIDIAKEVNLTNFFDLMEPIINEGHIIEKEIFFSLLSEDFLNTFNPVY